MGQPSRTLHRLIYRSRQTPAVAADLDFEVRRIISAAIGRNRTVGLTGLLLVVQGHFIQALEGNVDEVRTTYARISLDTRHCDLHIISQGPAEKRMFAEWNMCARTLAPSDKAILDLLDGNDVINVQSLTTDSTLRLLTTVASIQRRTALTALLK